MKKHSTPHAIKVIVWDLDNTLWHGILAEGDAVQLREGIREIIETTDRWGILHSIASKNNHEDAWAILESLGLAEYFLYPQIHWGAKSGSILAIKEAINIGFDAIAFIDDQPFERDEVLHVHPEVNCFDLDILPELLAHPAFVPRFITDESGHRRAMYKAEEVRKAAEVRYDNNNAFLESLEMRFRIAPATSEDLRRVEELTLRTNQLNATGYTYTYEELCNLIASPRHQLYVAELVDKYGTYGKVGVALLECDPGLWTVKLLLMSCRVLSRGVGAVLLQFLMQHAHASGVRLQAEFRHTDRNRQMYVTYKFAGFQTAAQLDDKGELLEHSLADLRAYPHHIVLDIVTHPIL